MNSNELKQYNTASISATLLPCRTVCCLVIVNVTLMYECGDGGCDKVGVQGDARSYSAAVGLSWYTPLLYSFAIICYEC
jgi:hypothetical protein